jgi:hypothetical protein
VASRPTESPRSVPKATVPPASLGTAKAQAAVVRGADADAGAIDVAVAAARSRALSARRSHPKARLRTRTVTHRVADVAGDNLARPQLLRKRARRQPRPTFQRAHLGDSVAHERTWLPRRRWWKSPLRRRERESPA